MAPEVIRGSTKYGPEIDVYSFAIIMWEVSPFTFPKTQ